MFFTWDNTISRTMFSRTLIIRDMMLGPDRPRKFCSTFLIYSILTASHVCSAVSIVTPVCTHELMKSAVIFVRWNVTPAVAELDIPNSDVGRGSLEDARNRARTSPAYLTSFAAGAGRALGL